MIRSALFLSHVLSLVAPHFPERDAAAHLLRDLGREGHFDPITEIVIVDNESRWNPSAVSADGSVGLGQPRLTNFRECHDLQSEACADRKASLLNWRTNLRVSAKLIVGWKAYCKRTVGSEMASAWLRGYQGFDATHHTTCGHRRIGKRWVAVPVPELTRRVLARRRELAK